MSKRPPETHCYLCGDPLEGPRPTNNDHIPPKQFIPRHIRRRYKVQLTTRRTHVDCNHSYKLDEEYLVHCFAPFIRGTETGNAIVWKLGVEFRSGKNVGLVRRVLDSASHSLRGIHLPRNLVALDYEQARIERVVLKILRGLICIRSGDCSPSIHNPVISITFPGRAPPDHFEYFMTNVRTESLGDYQAVFAYRHADIGEMSYWALLFWDRVLATVMYNSVKDAPPPDSGGPSG